MVPITFSLAILHTPWRPERVRALLEMLDVLDRDVPITHKRRIFDEERPAEMAWSEFKTVIALRQWEWSLATNATHHLFLTDDLDLPSKFWRVLHAMVAAKPESIIGLLSNHPKGPELQAAGDRWYRCNSWVVGPAYVVPREKLEGFVAWYKSLPDTEEPRGRRWFNDDSALNEWNTYHGPKESWHPLPTIVEHRADLESTVGHGDRYSRERVSWRATREVVEDEDGWRWLSEPAAFDLDEMSDVEYWRRLAPMLGVGEG